MLRGLLITMRPNQWIKNLLVAAAPLSAGTILQVGPAGRTALAFVAFCLASSSLYCVNDVRDAASDRHHPRKRLRPVASAELSPTVALIAAAFLAIAAVAIATPNPLRLVILSYLAMNVAYSAGLKHQPVIELAIVASGFLLRAIAGGPATGIPLSQWFLIVAAFGSLFIVTGKRLSERLQLGETAGISRPILTSYSASYLRMVVGISAAVTIAAYGLWAFEVGADQSGPPWAAISIVPFVTALLRYLLDVDAGTAQEPEQIVMRDCMLQALAVLWLVTFSLSVLHG
jgi:decaprenyl-phosphate phosphoribosyltransferase